MSVILAQQKNLNHLLLCNYFSFGEILYIDSSFVTLLQLELLVSYLLSVDQMVSSQDMLHSQKVDEFFLIDFDHLDACSNAL